MLLQRVLTSLLLIPIVLALIFYSGKWVFASLLAVLMFGMAYEWLQLIPLKKPAEKILFFLTLAAVLVLVHLSYLYWILPGVVIWALIILLIVLYPASQSFWGFRAVAAFWGLCLLPLFAVSMLNIFEMPQGRALIVYLLCLVWAADIGAYAAGKQWGRHKLIPAVSPGKTWEGAGGGLLLVLLVAFSGYLYFQPASAVAWMLTALIVAVISLFGDLFVSMLKRRAQIKDTGHILPGHGGILDRMDSLMAAAVFFNAALYSLG